MTANTEARADALRPADAFVRGIDVHTLLPQQEPFVMVGRLEHFDETVTVTSTTIAADNIFVDGGRFSVSGLVENIAQTCAARIGYVNTYVLRRGVQIGFIGAVRGLTVDALPRVGETIVTRVSVEEEIFGMTLATATVSLGDREIARTEIKIALKEDAATQSL